MKRKLTLMLALLFVWTGVAWSQVWGTERNVY